MYVCIIITFLASFSAFKRNFSSFFRFSAEYSFLLFSFTIFSLILLLHSFEAACSLVFDVFLLLFSEMMKNGLRDVDGGVVRFGFSVGEANARVVVGGFVGLIGATFAVMPNFETADCELVVVAVVAVVVPLNRGTVSSDDDDDADFDFCDVYEANLIFARIQNTFNMICIHKYIIIVINNNHKQWNKLMSSLLLIES